jgi:hypothetical protein
MLPTKFQFIWESNFRGEFFLEINQSETRVVGKMSVLATGSVMLLQCGKGKPP